MIRRNVDLKEKLGKVKKSDWNVKMVKEKWEKMV